MNKKYPHKLLIKLNQILETHQGSYTFSKNDNLWMALIQKGNQKEIILAGYYLKEFSYAIEIDNHNLMAKSLIKDRMNQEFGN